MSNPLGPPLVTFQSPHSAHLDLSLSRHGSTWFLTYPRAYGMLSYPGQRIHAQLNASTTSEVRESAHVIWFNSDWTGTGTMANPFNILVDASPGVVRATGRKRTEKSCRIEGEEVESVEFEVLVPEEGLLRQCYYCLDWEQPGVPRFAKCISVNDDDYWCPSVCRFILISLYFVLIFRLVSGKGTTYCLFAEWYKKLNGIQYRSRCVSESRRIAKGQG
jgi:hypothetical protein